ncbi:MAG: hypothetical protein QG622_3527 [Actinomycetota bacterium]|nr:hypothetical protein [Actinomycetota bacterium]
MGLFSRWRSTTDASGRQQGAIEEFWAWWRDAGASETVVAIRSRDPHRVVDEISRRIGAIHCGLGWELGAGRTSEHVLVVSSEGDAELRAVARRWRQAAPPPDAIWEYSDARVPVPDAAVLVLSFDDVPIDVASVRVAARVNGSVLDVNVYHPDFAKLPERTRSMASFILLDQVLGEDAVETWVGEVGVSTVLPLDPVPLTGLPAVVADLREMFTTEDGRPAWILLEGSGPDGRPVLAGTQVPLKATAAPHLDTHVAVDVPFSDLDDHGLPGPGSRQALRDLGAHLEDRLGGSGRVVAHETHGGRRVLHAYVDGATPAVEQLKAAVAGWEQGPVVISSHRDPAWERVSHLRA